MDDLLNDFEEKELYPKSESEKEEPEDYMTYERTIIMQAINAALKVFYKVFEDGDLDAAYFRPSITVELRDSSFTETLGKITYEDLS